MNDDLRSTIDDLFPEIQSTLEELVRIPSVSAAAFDAAEVRRSAEAVAALYTDAGFPDVRLLEIEGAHPAVFAHSPAPPGAPTVLLYAHHDVQPPGPDSEWSTAPFEPVVREGRMYGRGTSDDKANVVLHAGVMRAFGGRPPVGLKVFVEGEEEVGSAHLGDYLEAHGDLLAADVIVIADSANWRVGHPALTVSLRGVAAVIGGRRQYIAFTGYSLVGVDAGPSELAYAPEHLGGVHALRRQDLDARDQLAGSHLPAQP